MSHKLISRSPDLKKLRDEGYDIEVRSTYLLMNSVPYVNSRKEVRYGTLVSELTLAGDMTTRPGNHVAHFIGDFPCHKDGSEISRIKSSSGQRALAKDVVIHHSFSSRPSTGYANFYDKMTTYAAIIAGPAQAIDPSVKTNTFPVVETSEAESVFNYFDTASSRAGINLVTAKLELGKIAIVGVGGTGSYVLDLVGKTPVKEIHLFDGDIFLNHNAFRSPGTPSVDELRGKPQKVLYFTERYSRMHRNIIAHDCYVDASNVMQLLGMDFVFPLPRQGRTEKGDPRKTGRA